MSGVISHKRDAFARIAGLRAEIAGLDSIVARVLVKGIPPMPMAFSKRKLYDIIVTREVDAENIPHLDRGLGGDS